MMDISRMILINNVCLAIQDVYIAREAKVHNVPNVNYHFTSIKVNALIHVLLISTKILIPNPVKLVIDSVIPVMDLRLIIAYLVLKICTITKLIKHVM